MAEGQLALSSAAGDLMRSRTGEQRGSQVDCHREGSANVQLLLEARPTSVASVQTHDGGVSHNIWSCGCPLY